MRRPDGSTAEACFVTSVDIGLMNPEFAGKNLGDALRED